MSLWLFLEISVVFFWLNCNRIMIFFPHFSISTAYCLGGKEAIKKENISEKVLFMAQNSVCLLFLSGNAAPIYYLLFNNAGAYVTS